MKISVDLSQPVSQAFDSPSPLQAALLDCLKEIRCDEWMLRIGVCQTHNAFTMPQQLADAPCVEPGIIHGFRVDCQQVVAEGVGAGQIKFREHSFIANSFEIQRIVLTRDVFR